LNATRDRIEYISNRRRTCSTTRLKAPASGPLRFASSLAVRAALGLSLALNSCFLIANRLFCLALLLVGLAALLLQLALAFLLPLLERDPPLAKVIKVHNSIAVGIQILQALRCLLKGNLTAERAAQLRRHNSAGTE
jgi:hypothetical protein